ncbi:hypothetical protein [Actinokineospora pegani]|uniref:hypothetical protein n=1 Tax=Actinokineospora pegani TaxID=2654637 RepID=UPI0012EA25D2|nr:hypothetical protein [Actinokineospora pegani]
MRTSLTGVLAGGPARWTIAGTLAVAAAVNSYLALSESVLWPVPLAVLWIVLAAGVLTVRADNTPKDGEDLPTTAHEALSLTNNTPRALHSV